MRHTVTLTTSQRLGVGSALYERLNQMADFLTKQINKSIQTANQNALVTG